MHRLTSSRTRREANAKAMILQLRLAVEKTRCVLFGQRSEREMRLLD